MNVIYGCVFAHIYNAMFTFFLFFGCKKKSKKKKREKGKSVKKQYACTADGSTHNSKRNIFPCPQYVVASP